MTLQEVAPVGTGWSFFFLISIKPPKIVSGTMVEIDVGIVENSDACQFEGSILWYQQWWGRPSPSLKRKNGIVEASTLRDVLSCPVYALPFFHVAGEACRFETSCD